MSFPALCCLIFVQYDIWCKVSKTGRFTLSGSSLVLLFLLSLTYKSKLLIRWLDMFVESVSIFLAIEAFIQHIFRKQPLVT